MAARKNSQLSNYYVIKFEKYIELMNDIETKYNILADMLYEIVSKNEPKNWDATPIHAILDAYVNAKDIRNFLNDKVNNVPPEVVKLAKENNIKDILVIKEDVQVMNALLLAAEELESRLAVEEKIFLVTH